MQRSHLIAGLAAILLLTAACARSSQPPKPEAPGVQAPTPAPPPPPSQAPAADPREAALAAMRRADWAEAIARWQEVIDRSPTAGNWNDLAYTYLLAGRWPEAIDAAGRALQLEPKHGPALYNRGMARLQLKEHTAAATDLRQSSLLQPGRSEPHLGLASAYTAQGRYALARHAISEASRLGAGREAIVVEETRIAPLHHTDTQLPGPCEQLYADEQLILCLATRGGFSELYAVQAGAGTERITLGEHGPAPGGRTLKVELPDGLTGFFLEGQGIGAAVSGSREWYLFVLKGGRLHQAVFTGNQEDFLTPVSDTLRSAGPPQVQGDEILADYRIDAGAPVTNEVARQFQPDSITAAYLSTDRYGLKGEPLPPITSSRAAFRALLAHPEVRESKALLGPLFIAVLMRESEEHFYISVGEDQPQRVRFESHWVVEKATGKVSQAGK